MAALNEHRIQEILLPYIGDAAVPHTLYAQLCIYLDLLLKWNQRTNLTAIRLPEEIVRRHFGESLFLGLHLPPSKTFLDYGSGAGFPGLPVHLLIPGLRVTLAESQSKKASFLRETVRILKLETEVWPGRVEVMDPQKRFDIVALRAVDKMEEATRTALSRLAPGGTLALLMAGSEDGIPIPHSKNRVVRFIQ